MDQVKQDDEKIKGAEKGENVSTVDSILRTYSKTDRCHNCVKMKVYNWQPFYITMLLFYMVVVAQSGEITVKCRSIASEFKESEVVALFTFFEIEVMAFGGILIGLSSWLIYKWIFNNIYTEGPMYTFKTKGVKQTTDTLVRNYMDAYITTGIFWVAAINVYLTTQYNVARDVMTESQKTLVSALVGLWLVQSIAFFILRAFS